MEVNPNPHSRIGNEPHDNAVEPAELDRLKMWCFRRIIDWQHGWGQIRPRATKLAPPSLTIFKPDGIGDFVLATGAIRWLENWAREELGLSTRVIVADFTERLARRELPGCEIIAIPYHEDRFAGRPFSVIRQTRKALSVLEAPILVSLRHQPSLLQDLALGQIPARKSFATRACPFFHPHGNRRFRADTLVSYPESVSDVPLELAAHAALLSVVTGQAVTPGQIKPRLDQFRAFDGRSLLVFPFAGHAIRECSPGQLAEMILAIDHSGFDAIVFCGPSRNRDKLEIFRAALGRIDVATELAMPDTITEATEIIAGAGAVLAMESGPAHIATALDKRAVLILGGGHYGYFAPWGNPLRQKWVRHPLACYNCGWHCPFPSTECITRIPAAEVATAFQQIMKSSESRDPENHVS
jgi:ADP-heptose:LPS heptosyltransferase